MCALAVNVFLPKTQRCIVMVGLPYPDKRDPELQQKIAYLDKADARRWVAYRGKVGGGKAHDVLEGGTASHSKADVVRLIF